VKLAACYWYTLEFGLLWADEAKTEKKIYGAGILSSFGEIEYSMSGEPPCYDFDASVVERTHVPITKYQEQYFVMPSFDCAKRIMMDYSKTIKRPFNVTYDPNLGTLMTDRKVRASLNPAAK
jgi:phenylalanine-4-hydroxylase